jgi:hypothetical protein
MDYDDSQTRDVYAHFGLAMFLAQGLEHAIVNSLVILRLPLRGQLTRADIDSLMEKNFRKPLGEILRALRSEVELPADLEATLTEALKVRNHLAHHYFRERANQFVSRSGRDQMLQELQVHQRLFEAADDQLGIALKPLRTKYGLTDEVYEAEFNRMCAELDIAP